MSLIRLPYLGKDAVGVVKNSPRGYSEIQGVEQYSNEYVRSVRIIRVDLLLYLTEHFSIDTLVKYRDSIYYILSGHGASTNKELIAKSIEYIYTLDNIFRIKMGKIIYFRDTTLEGLSVYDALLADVYSIFYKIKSDVIRTVPYIKIIGDSSMYVYISISKLIDITTLSNIKGLVVLSR